jgi:competence protein ComEA
MPSFTLSRRSALLAVGFALAVVLLASRLLAGPAPPERPVAAPFPAADVERAPDAARIVVDVAGAVRRPGVYRLRQGARIADAIARAGGATRLADKVAVNLAAPLADGMQVLVPQRGRGPAGAAPTGSAAGPLSLNSATLEQLDALPGIGPVTAQKILDYRREHGPFRSVDELDAIPGIGPARLENLRGLVVP